MSIPHPRAGLLSHDTNPRKQTSYQICSRSHGCQRLLRNIILLRAVQHLCCLLQWYPSEVRYKLVKDVPSLACFFVYCRSRKVCPSCCPGAFSKGLADSISPDNLAGETLKLQKQLNTIAALHQMRGRHAAYLPNRRSPEASARKRSVALPCRVAIQAAPSVLLLYSVLMAASFFCRQHRVSADNSEAAALLLDENDIEAILESVCGPSALPSTAEVKFCSVIITAMKSCILSFVRGLRTAALQSGPSV